MIGTISHALACVLAQLVIAHFTGNYWLGVVSGTAYYLGREVAQTEDRYHAEYALVFLRKLRAFDPRAWNVKGLADWLLPLTATTLVALWV